jgi:ubiquinone/menaquinone biosynthesis C-methylase UbiE
MAHEKRFKRAIERLRDPERVERLEVHRVVDTVLQDLDMPLSVLDVGTGSGLFAELFAARGLQVGGVDANSEMIPVARGFVPSGIFQEAEAESLPFDDGAFDIVFMGLLLHETDDPLAALKHARRVARRRVAVLEWPEGQHEVGPPPEERLSDELIISLTTEAGLQLEEQIRLNHLVLYLFK